MYGPGVDSQRLSVSGAPMSTYTRKPVTATAHCPICPWIRTHFQNGPATDELKRVAAISQAQHILSVHSSPKGSVRCR